MANRNRLFEGADALGRLYLRYLRGISAHPGSRKLRRYISRYVFPGGIKMVSPYGAFMRFGTTDYIDQKVVYTGAYEPGSLALSSQLLERGGHFIDVGANIGIFSLNLSCNPRVRTISVEPNAEAFYLLRENLKLNGFDNVVLVNVALGDTPGLVAMENTAINNLGCCRIGAEGKKIHHIRHYIHMVTLDQLVRHFHLDHVTLLKVDVEGFEMKVLKGIDWKSGGTPDNILLEYLPEQAEGHGLSAGACVNYILAHDYSAYNIHGEPYTEGRTDVPENNLWLKKMCL